MAAAPIPAAPSGAVPPQNLEAEESVLGAMMMSPGAIIAVREVVDAGDFYRESHGRIYRAALALHDADEPVDAITLTNELEQRGHLHDVGGRIRVHELARLVPASANARHYAEIVHDTATLRGLIRAGGEIAQLGWDREGDTSTLVDQARQIADQLLDRGSLSGQLEAQTWAEFERDATEHIPLLVEGLWPEAGLGFIAAPPKKGKTWVGLDLAISVATGTEFLGRFKIPEPQPAIYVALEGHKAAIRGRIGCLTRGHGLNPAKGSADLANLHILYKPPGLNLSDPAWTHAVHQLVNRTGARLLILDVLRAAATQKENSNDEFRELVRALQPITNSGCSLALLHHFGKLTESTRDRSPGERMSGAGAMWGAYDVGVFITGSDDGGRRLRVEFEARDLPAPEPAGVYLAGEPTGPNGGFIFTDEARWIEQAPPDPDDVKAPAEEIADYVREQGGDVERRIVEAYFEISDKTLGARLSRLDGLGIDLVRGTGRGHQARLVARVENIVDQLDLPITDAYAVHPRKSSESKLGVESSDSELYATPNFTPLNQAKNGQSSESSEKLGVEPLRTFESADLQGEKSSESSDSLLRREQPPADAAAPPREADDDIDFGP